MRYCGAFSVRPPEGALVVPVSRPLANIGVLVTRPSHQAQRLCSLIDAQGGKAIRFPVMDILDPRDPGPVRAAIERLESYDMAIFTSANAVRRAVALIGTRQNWPGCLIIAAIGRASARELERLGVAPQLVPEAPFNSEALLKLPRMQAVAGQSVLIFRGEGGRELLGDTLRARGAQVDEAAVYRRDRPRLDPAWLLKCWQRGEIHAVTVTSNESLQNLFAIVGAVGQQWLCVTPLVVVSSRARQLARELGVGHPVMLAREASDEAILETLLKWRQARFE